MSISIKDLSFAYDKELVLKNINLNIESYQFTAIMGLSGCGKTTLLRLLLGLNDFSQGSISLGDVKYSKENLSKIRKMISYVPQHGALYPHLSVEKNILLPLEVHREVLVQDHEKVQELCAICNLDKALLSKLPSELSGGQRQRVSIIRALMMDTPYILMDEPFSALDPITKVTMQKEFKIIFKETKKTIVMVTHALNEAKYLCDQICILNAGNLVQADSFDNLVSKPSTDFVKDFVNAQL